MDWKKHLLEAATLIVAAIVCALVANAYALADESRSCCRAGRPAGRAADPGLAPAHDNPITQTVAPASTSRKSPVTQPSALPRASEAAHKDQPLPPQLQNSNPTPTRPRSEISWRRRRLCCEGSALPRRAPHLGLRAGSHRRRAAVLGVGVGHRREGAQALRRARRSARAGEADRHLLQRRRLRRLAHAGAEALGHPVQQRLRLQGRLPRLGMARTRTTPERNQDGSEKKDRRPRRITSPTPGSRSASRSRSASSSWRRRCRRSSIRRRSRT